MEKLQARPVHEVALRILLIEDSDTDALALQKSLLDGMKNAQLMRATTLTAGERVLEDGEIDLLFLDLCLPDAAVPSETYARIKKWANKFPIIVMTGIKDHDLAKKMIHEGAADFLSKDSLVENPGQLQKAVDFSIERHSISRQMLSEKNKAVKDSKEKDSILSCFMGGYSIDDESK